MLRQGKAHEQRDAEAKHLTEQRDAEPDKARHMREQELSVIMYPAERSYVRAAWSLRQSIHVNMRSCKNGNKEQPRLDTWRADLRERERDRARTASRMLRQSTWKSNTETKLHKNNGGMMAVQRGAETKQGTWESKSSVMLRQIKAHERARAYICCCDKASDKKQEWLWCCDKQFEIL